MNDVFEHANLTLFKQHIVGYYVNNCYDSIEIKILTIEGTHCIQVKNNDELQEIRNKLANKMNVRPVSFPSEIQIPDSINNGGDTAKSKSKAKSHG